MSTFFFKLRTQAYFIIYFASYILHSKCTSYGVAPHGPFTPCGEGHPAYQCALPVIGLEIDKWPNPEMKMESALGLVSGLSEVMVHEEDVDFMLPLGRARAFFTQVAF